jgi:hypothetical protein
MDTGLEYNFYNFEKGLLGSSLPFFRQFRCQCLEYWQLILSCVILYLRQVCCSLFVGRMAIPSALSSSEMRRGPKF